jgi:glycosidase
LGEGCEPWPESQSKCTSHGYWAYQWYQIDRHFGTKDDFKHLAAEVHKRDMFVMYDFVTNHVGPVHSTADLSRIYPFNKPEYFSQLKIQELVGGDFDKYVKLYGNWPPPVQALWTGAQCGEEFRSPTPAYPNGCNCWACPVDPGFGPCSQNFSFWEQGPCPRDTISPFCMAGDYACKGYSEEQTHFGWFYDLGDLNQSNPEVKAMLLQWGRYMVDTFDLDAIRLDTASYMPLCFLQALQEAVCVPIIGESTVTNMTFLAQLQADPPPTGKKGLAGALNFPLTYAAVPAFCGMFEKRYWPFAHKNMSFLGARMVEQLEAPYLDANLLGNQIDNHDMDRITVNCRGDMSLVRNALVWNMLAQGMPTIYYGTEVYETEQRMSFWQHGWNTKTPGYKFLKTLNMVRKRYNVGKSPLTVVSATENTLIFTRGKGKKLWVFLNNFGNTTQSVKYCPPKKIPMSFYWDDALTGKSAKFDAKGCLSTRSTEPVVLVCKGSIKQ